MDALALLRSVAETYAGLKSLETEVSSVNERHERGSLQRTETTLRMLFVAPNKVRIEQPGQVAPWKVCNDAGFYQYDWIRKRVMQFPAPSREHLPGMFNPEFPTANNGQCFLYDRIAEHVAAAEVLEDTSAVDEDGRPLHIVSVTYDPPRNHDIGYSSSPVRFWIDPRSRLVVRQAGEFTSVFRPWNLKSAGRETLSFSSMEVNKAIPETMFQLTLPEGAESISSPMERARTLGRSGSTFRDSRGVECRRLHAWEGEAFVERAEWVFKGQKVEVETRWEISEDSAQLRITEHVKGPKNAAENRCTLFTE